MFLLYGKKYDQGSVAENERHCAYSIMFIGNARKSFCDYLSNKNQDLMSLVIVMKERLQTTERTWALLR